MSRLVLSLHRCTKTLRPVAGHFPLQRPSLVLRKPRRGLPWPRRHIGESLDDRAASVLDPGTIEILPYIAERMGAGGRPYARVRGRWGIATSALGHLQMRGGVQGAAGSGQPGSQRVESNLAVLNRDESSLCVLKRNLRMDAVGVTKGSLLRR
jgi:hypothetical protein